ncbi:MAG: hypothetical protein IT342_01275 [Candidatus Melainabacteria bacterium]|nr:hypothetical protein [Candidatus Melainabacteria bacterium]
MSNTDRSQANWALAVKALREIDAIFGSEENCRLIVLAKIAECQKINCRRCGNENVIPAALVRKFLCRNCKKEISLTARTLFHRAQKFRYRLVMLELIARGIVLSANQQAEITNVSNDTINKFVQKLAFGAVGLMKDFAVEILSVFCQPAVSRRTLQTPAGEPPYAEEFTLQKMTTTQPKQENKPDDYNLEGLSEKEKSVFDLVSSSAAPIPFDEICQKSQASLGELSSSLMSLELQGLVDRKPGDKYEISTKHHLPNTLSISNAKTIERQQRLAKNLVYFVKDHYQGIGRKYEQLYSALYWFYHDRKRWTFDSLLEFCVSIEYIRNQEILDYVTPLSFKIVMLSGTS